ncbi:MAG: taurine catabolism dioxygenase TauD [Rhodospirillaceae bacterium]|nr:taurine catabolism dioxygenase TauD [Rhodospirillaceae bacterium]|tara:strand:+ start:2668 stop:3522 length:855 start_codon:yes stop_codon:yes gene_type:complete
MTITIDLEPLSEAVGMAVRGVDLRETLDDSTQDDLRDLFAKECVLCFPDQDITAEDQRRFAAIFGRVDTGNRGNSKKDLKKAATRGEMLVTNIRENGKPIGSLPDGEMQFHSDGAHRQVPYRATTLYGIRIPSTGGNTMFANLQAAYDALSPEIKGRIDELQTQTVYDYEAQNRSTIGSDPDLPRAQHALVKTHPVTGRKSLYLSRLMTEKILDMDHDDSETLLAELFDHAEKPEFVYSHKWTPGDLVIWDNRSTNHARTDFPPEEQRLLRRYTISDPDAPLAN